VTAEQSADAIEITVNRPTCAGTAVCAFYAPGTFDLDDQGKVQLIETGSDPASAVINAAEACPTRSIRLSS